MRPAGGLFRSDMILAHRRYTGQLNVPDMFTRLLLSIAATGLAPRSFYRADDTGRPAAHYDGLPVDFTAAAVAELAARTTSGYQTFNVVNPHDDGASLDAFVDWLIDAGLRIHRIDDHAWRAHSAPPSGHCPTSSGSTRCSRCCTPMPDPPKPVAGSARSADRFRAAVRAAALTKENDIPHLSQDLITKYVADLRSQRLL